MKAGDLGRKVNRGVCLYVLAFLLSAIPALFLSAPFVEDSLGTMGAAAFLTGHDWGDFLVDKGFYYKYGQSLFYLPVFFCVHDPVVRYKALLLVNSALMAFVPVLAYRIGERHLELPSLDAACIALISGCMPAALLYGKLTWAEPSLFLIPWVILYILLELESPAKGSGAAGYDVGFAQAGGDVSIGSSECSGDVGRIAPIEIAAGMGATRRKRILSALLAWGCAFAFMAHQRGIIVVLGTVLFLIMRAVKDKKPLVSPFVFGANLVVALILDRFLDAWQKLYVYHGAELKHNLLSAFLHIEIYQKLFSPEGLKVVLGTVLGWLFNSAVSGLGISLLGILISFACALGFKKVNGALGDRFRTICMLGAILYLGALFLGVLFFFETLYDYWQGIAVERCDHLVFGRYLESTLPLMMFAGLYALTRLSVSGGDGKCGSVGNADDAEDCREIGNSGEAGNCREIGNSGGPENCGDINVRNILLRMSGCVWAVMILLSAFFIVAIAPAMKGIDSYVHSLMSMNICFDMTGVSVTNDVISNLGTAIIVFALVCCILFPLFVALSKRGKIRAVFIITGVLFLYIYLRSFCDILYRIDVRALTDFAQYYLR